MSTETKILTPAEETPTDAKRESSKLRVITWFSVGMAVAALGIFLGHELRSRYKFKQRTPYDYYANAGEQAASEFGVGIESRRYSDREMPPSGGILHLR